jgi:inosine/xanthosine triphosphatase
LKPISTELKNVYIGSGNPVKIACTEEAFKRTFPGEKFSFSGRPVGSGVSDQPMTDRETYLGAKSRVENLRQLFPEGDYWVGIEGGLEEINGSLHAFAWMVVRSEDLTGEARTATFPLPGRISELVREGMELGHADDLVFKRSNSKQKDGAVGILSQGIIDRKHYYLHAMILALIPFMNRTLY